MYLLLLSVVTWGISLGADDHSLKASPTGKGKSLEVAFGPILKAMTLEDAILGLRAMEGEGIEPTLEPEDLSPSTEMAERLVAELVKRKESELRDLSAALATTRYRNSARFVDTLIKAKKRNKQELVRALSANLASAEETRVNWLELKHRFKTEGRQYAGFVASPELVRKIQNELVIDFLRSPEGRRFVWDRSGALLGGRKNSAPPPKNATLGKALREWDQKHGKVLETLGMAGINVEKAMEKLQEELGGKELVLGFFLPEKHFRELVQNSVRVAVEPYIPRITAMAEAKTNQTINSIQGRIAAHPKIAKRRYGVTVGSVEAQRPDALKGAREGATDGVMGRTRNVSGESSAYRKAYSMSHEIAWGKARAVEAHLEDEVTRGLKDSLSLGLEKKGIYTDLVKHAPQKKGSFPRDKKDPEYAGVSYFSLYEKLGDQSRQTYAGFYTPRIDENLNLRKRFDNGDIYRWLTEGAK